MAAILAEQNLAATFGNSNNQNKHQNNNNNNNNNNNTKIKQHVAPKHSMAQISVWKPLGVSNRHHIHLLHSKKLIGLSARNQAGEGLTWTSICEQVSAATQQRPPKSSNVLATIGETNRAELTAIVFCLSSWGFAVCMWFVRVSRSGQETYKRSSLEEALCDIQKH